MKKLNEVQPKIIMEDGEISFIIVEQEIAQTRPFALGKQIVLSPENLYYCTYVFFEDPDKKLFDTICEKNYFNSSDSSEPEYLTKEQFEEIGYINDEITYVSKNLKSIKSLSLLNEIKTEDDLDKFCMLGFDYLHYTQETYIDDAKLIMEKAGIEKRYIKNMIRNRFKFPTERERVKITYEFLVNKLNEIQEYVNKVYNIINK